jgi:hypothetical protein
MVKNLNGGGTGGTGNVNGPASATDGHLAVFDGATGKIIKDGGAPAGGGDVTGPSSAADADIVLFDGVTGKILKDSSKTIVTTLGATDTTIPTSKAVKDVTDLKIAKTANITALNETGIADGEIAVFNLTNKDIRTSDKTIVTTLGADDTTIPTSKAVKDTKIDELAIAGTSNTDRDANTTNHGLLLKAVAGASAGFAKAVVCLYGQTIYSLQELYDATVPAVLGTASAGSATTLARRDHVHSAELTLADGKSVELKKALGTDHTCSGLTVTLKAHETTTLFQVGFINSDGEVALADADAVATMPVRAMATAGISANADGVYLLKGYAVNASWSWTPGAILYASGTPGAITATAPTGTGKVVQVIGYAVTATIIFFAPDMTWLELS